MCVCAPPAARFIVHVRHPGVIVLQNKKQGHQHYLAIKGGTHCTVGVLCMSAMHIASRQGGYHTEAFVPREVTFSFFFVLVGSRWTVL